MGKSFVDARTTGRLRETFQNDRRRHRQQSSHAGIGRTFDWSEGSPLTMKETSNDRTAEAEKQESQPFDKEPAE